MLIFKIEHLFEWGSIYYYLSHCVVNFTANIYSLYSSDISEFIYKGFFFDWQKAENCLLKPLTSTSWSTSGIQIQGISNHCKIQKCISTTRYAPVYNIRTKIKYYCTKTHFGQRPQRELTCSVSNLWNSVLKVVVLKVVVLAS